MTLIVGILCEDGVVIGSDSAVTFALTGQSGQGRTIEQSSKQKIHIVEGHIIVAGTGQHGLGQRFLDIIKQRWKDREFTKERNIVNVGRTLSHLALKDFAQTGVMQPAIEYGALVAVPCNGKAELVEFTVLAFQPEVKTKDDIWYVSMGSGQAVADPLLGFMRKTFWGNSPPSRQDGIFAVAMVLELACEMAPGGVAGPSQIAVLGPNPKEGGKLFASRLTEAELLEHKCNVESVLKYFSRYKESFHEDSESKKKPPSLSPEISG